MITSESIKPSDYVITILTSKEGAELFNRQLEMLGRVEETPRTTGYMKELRKRAKYNDPRNKNSRRYRSSTNNDH